MTDHRHEALTLRTSHAAFMEIVSTAPLPDVLLQLVAGVVEHKMETGELEVPDQSILRRFVFTDAGPPPLLEVVEVKSMVNAPEKGFQCEFVVHGDEALIAALTSLEGGLVLPPP